MISSLASPSALPSWLATELPLPARSASPLSREAGEQLLELESPRTQVRLALQRRHRTVQPDRCVQHAAGHAETQRFQAELAVVEHYVGI
ncbi:hypothetical protein D3C84_887410 [compost metagenome]